MAASTDHLKTYASHDMCKRRQGDAWPVTVDGEKRWAAPIDMIDGEVIESAVFAVLPSRDEDHDRIFRLMRLSGGEYAVWCVLSRRYSSPRQPCVQVFASREAAEAAYANDITKYCNSDKWVKRED